MQNRFKKARRDYQNNWKNHLQRKTLPVMYRFEEGHKTS